MKSDIVKNFTRIGGGLLAIGLLICSGLVMAQSAFSRADSDDSGAIDFEEFRAYMADIYYHTDSDHNGLLAGEELKILNQDRLRTTDTNNDGVLNLREFLNSTGADFRSSDRDNNNLLGPGEL